MIAQREALTAEPIAAVPVAHFATTKTIDPPLASLAGQRFTAVGRRAKRLLFTAQDGNTLQVHLMSAGRLAVGARRLKTAMLVVAVRVGPRADDVRVRAQAPRRCVAAAPRRACGRARPHRPRAARPGVHAGGAGRDAAGAPAPAARVPARPARDRRHRPRVRERDPARARCSRHTSARRPCAMPRWSACTPRSRAFWAPRCSGWCRCPGTASTTKADRGYVVHDRLGEPCPRCGEAIRRVSFDEHTVFYCPHCQTGDRILADRRLSRLLRE